MDYFLFLVLFTVSSIVMYVLDGLIAFFIPASRVEKRLKDEKTVSLLTKLYGQGVWKAVKGDIEESAERIFQRFSNEIENKLNTNITNIVNNDVKHIIDDSIDELCQDIPTQEDMNALISSLRGITSMAGVNAKSEKKAERQAKIAFIAQSGEKHSNKVNQLMMSKKLLGLSQSEVDQGLDLICYQINKEKGESGHPGTKAMPPLQAGPYLQEIPALQEKSQPRQTSMGTLSNADAKRALKEQLTAMGMPAEAQKEMFRKGDEANAKKKEKREETT